MFSFVSSYPNPSACAGAKMRGVVLLEDARGIELESLAYMLFHFTGADYIKDVSFHKLDGAVPNFIPPSGDHILLYDQVGVGVAPIVSAESIVFQPVNERMTLIKKRRAMRWLGEIPEGEEDWWAANDTVCAYNFVLHKSLVEYDSLGGHNPIGWNAYAEPVHYTYLLASALSLGRLTPKDAPQTPDTTLQTPDALNVFRHLRLLWEAGPGEHIEKQINTFSHQAAPFIDVLRIWRHVCEENCVKLACDGFESDADVRRRLRELGYKLGVEEIFRSHFDEGVPVDDLFF